jgi:SsrA-binding protein
MSAAHGGGTAPKEFRNAKAGRDYHIGQRFEAGIVLRGTEVKAIRGGRINLADSFCRVERGEVFAYHLHISEYAFGNINNHVPLRPRKLLLGRREIEKVRVAIEAGGEALIPLRLYFKQGLVKLEVALCLGKKQFDKREDLKRRAQQRDIDQAMKVRR